MTTMMALKARVDAAETEEEVAYEIWQRATGPEERVRARQIWAQRRSEADLAIDTYWPAREAEVAVDPEEQAHEEARWQVWKERHS